ncbi:hypothetical protein L7F22_057321 [Adiantum nelumboides]|nr:hypothetical protein [Adiantum nelumboides]
MCLLEDIVNMDCIICLYNDMKTPLRKCTMTVADGGSANVLSSSSKPMSSTTLGIKSKTIGDKIIARSSWKIQYPKQTQFCYTGEELHEEYGLSLEGKLYQHLDDADVTDQDWLSVFMKKREKGSKIFLHMMRPEFVDECSTSLVSTSFISQQLKTEVEQILDSKRDALKVLNTTLDNVRVELQDKNQNMWKIQGTSSATTVLQGQLQELQILRSSMMGAVDIDPDFLVIEGKIGALTNALTALGDACSSSNIRDEVDRLKAVVSVPGLCAACGLAFMASHVVCVYTLACGHAYHALCFAAWLGSEMVCANASCKRSIPNSLKSMLLHTGSGHIPCVAPIQDDKVVLRATPKAHSVDSNYQGTPAVKVEPLVRTAAVEPQPIKSSPKDDAMIDDAEAVAKEGVDAVQRMVAVDEYPDSPIFLSDMVKVLKKRKNKKDG